MVVLRWGGGEEGGDGGGCGSRWLDEWIDVLLCAWFAYDTIIFLST